MKLLLLLLIVATTVEGVPPSLLMKSRADREKAILLQAKPILLGTSSLTKSRGEDVNIDNHCLSSWIESNDLSQFLRLTFDTRNGSSCVLGMQLDGCGLGGSIPSVLGQLQCIETLYLNFNELTGTIPAELDNLTTLKEFYITSNLIEGPLPEMPQWTRLTYIDVGSNRLNGTVPLGFFTNQKPNMKMISFWGNAFNRLPELTDAEIADTDFNTNIKGLILLSNNVEGDLPRWFSKLTGVTSLCVGGNRFRNWIPDEWQSMTNLYRLDLSNNQLTGPLPGWLPSFAPGLSLVSLSGNCLDDVLDVVPSMASRLTYIDVTPGNCTLIHPPRVQRGLTTPFSVSNMSCSAGWEVESKANGWSTVMGINNTVADLMCPNNTYNSSHLGEGEGEQEPWSKWDLHPLALPTGLTQNNYYSLAFAIFRMKRFGPAGELPRRVYPVSFFSCAVVAQLRPLLRWTGSPVNQRYPEWHDKWQSVPTQPRGILNFSLLDVERQFGVEYFVDFHTEFWLAPLPSTPEQRPPGCITPIIDRWTRIKLYHPVPFWKRFVAHPCNVHSVGVASTTTCVKCPPHALCDGTSRIATTEAVWRPATSGGGVGGGFLPLIPCPRTNGCVRQHQEEGAQQPAASNGTDCADGYTGQFCAECNGSAYTRSGFDCVPCNHVGALIAIAVVAVVAVLVLATAAVYLALNPSTEPEWYDKYVLCGRTLLNHLSVVGVLSNTEAAASLGAAARGILHLQNSANSLGSLGSINSISCLGFTANILTLFDAQWIAFSIILALEGLFFGIRYRRLSVVLSVFLCLFQLFFASVSTSSAQLLRCSSVDFFRETDYLLGNFSAASPTTLTIKYQYWDPQLSCSADYQVRASVSLILFCIVIPCVIVALRIIFFKKRGGANNNSCVEYESEIRHLMAFLTLDYKESAWYWEFAVMVRKLFVSLAIFAPPGSLQIGLFQVVCAFSLLLTQRVSPFERASSNDLELLTLISSIVAAQMLQVAAVPGATSSGLIVAASVTIVATQVLTVILIVFVTLRRFSSDSKDYYSSVVVAEAALLDDTEEGPAVEKEEPRRVLLSRASTIQEAKDDDDGREMRDECSTRSWRKADHDDESAEELESKRKSTDEELERMKKENAALKKENADIQASYERQLAANATDTKEKDVELEKLRQTLCDLEKQLKS